MGGAPHESNNGLHSGRDYCLNPRPESTASLPLGGARIQSQVATERSAAAARVTGCVESLLVTEVDRKRGGAALVRAPQVLFAIEATLQRLPLEPQMQ